jgi:ABC-type glycerol-3-phosphate transport system permease component
MTTQTTTPDTEVHRPAQQRYRILATLSVIGRRLPSYTFVVLWALFTIFTTVWVIMTSFKDNRALFRDVWALPQDLQWANYEKAWSVVHMGDYFLNSILVVLASVVLILLLSAPAAYALSRYDFRGFGLLTNFFIAGMGIPYPLLFIPLFGLLSTLKIADTLHGLILVYVSLSIPFTVFMLTGFFRTLPSELADAAYIDGGNELDIFGRVMLPLAAPGIITAAIFNFIGLWNEYMLALIFITEERNRTLSLGLYSLQNSMQYTGDWVGLFAGVVIVMVPSIVFFVLLSEQMISGITMGAVKS